MILALAACLCCLWASLQHFGELLALPVNGKPHEVAEQVEAQGGLGASLLESRFKLDVLGQVA